MKDATMNFKFGLLAAALIVVAALASPSFGQTTFNLCATNGTVTMPDGVVVPIWGFVDTGGAPCVAGLANSLPGPELRPTPGAATMTVNLSNALPEAVSFFIPGLRPTSSTGAAGRFTREAAAGGTASYTFALRPGTFLYQSATDRIRTHVPMGLYGAMVSVPAAGTAYPGVTYEMDKVLVYSSIDPLLNANPAVYDGAKVVNWRPQYFLINGKASPATDPISVSTGANALLRMVNAGLKSVIPTFDGGLYADVIAEDAQLAPHRVRQYGVELQAGKTVDALVRAPNSGSYALYERSGQLTNGPATGGGMLTYIQAGAGVSVLELSAADYSVAENVAGGILTISVNRLGGSTGAASVDYATANGTAISGSDYTAATGTLTFADGVLSQSFTVAIADDTTFEPGETFAVSLSNPVGAVIGSNQNATVTILDNDESPGALQFSSAAYSVAENVAGGILTVAVNRVGGSAGAVSVNYATSNGTALAGSDYTAASGTLNFAAGMLTQSFNISILNDANFEANESLTISLSNPTGGAVLGSPSIASATITNDDAAPNVPPTAVDDVASAPVNSPGITFSVTANDTDPDGTIDVTNVVITTGSRTQFRGTVVENNDGTVTYTPRRGFRGTDTFQYTVRDNSGALSNVATVRVNVN